MIACPAWGTRGTRKAVTSQVTPTLYQLSELTPIVRNGRLIGSIGYIRLSTSVRAVAFRCCYVIIFMCTYYYYMYAVFFCCFREIFCPGIIGLPTTWPHIMYTDRYVRTKKIRTIVKINFILCIIW